MTIVYGLLNSASGNVLDDFDSEREALDALGPFLREHGSEALAELALLRFEGGHPALVATGDELVDLVEATTEQLTRLPG